MTDTDPPAAPDAAPQPDTSPAARKRGNQGRKPALNDRQWEDIRRQACAGTATATLARAYGVAPASIRNRALRDLWPTPKRQSAVNQLLTAQRICHRNALPQPDGNTSGGRHDINASRSDDASAELAPFSQNSTISTKHENNKGSLIIPSDPVQAAVADEVASLISQALGTLAPPASWQQLTQAFALYRQAKGLDKPATAPGSRVLIHVGGSRPRVRERGAAIEAETVPE